MNEDILLGKSVSKWDDDWVDIGELNYSNIEKYKGRIGIYRLLQEKAEIYIGVAKEIGNGKGLYKRLNDYIRKRSTSTESEAGIYIHDNANNLKVMILDIGDDIKAVWVAAYLELYFIDKYKPKYNSHGKRQEELNMIKANLVRCTQSFFHENILIFEKGKEYPIEWERDNKIFITSKPNEGYLFSSSHLPNDIVHFFMEIILIRQSKCNPTDVRRKNTLPTYIEQGELVKITITPL